ncbi:hypothetical protein HMJ29_20130 [Hymenobacter taeanensis]|uniref:Uncharacterized protein n=1 Tax=Hymenobacter taeanensis TaxID=2735321 RepID=A0A6M6BMC1_9BACT|nr:MULTISPECIES: hypothetical protein [Hymenobacter]QJX49089.1 hypothetical protein HMJ29_20130 [Hymenobacter taeanensis]UOQ81388.1 hypothetical protein MUN83_00885 [Hymenobacter sp. 5414T-23]
MSKSCTLRAYAEPDGPIVCLILVTHSRSETDLSEIELPYLLWQSMGTRAAAAMIAQLYCWSQPEVVRQLGRVTIRRSITNLLQLHQREFRSNLP